MTVETGSGQNPANNLEEYNRARLFRILNSELNPGPSKNPNIYFIKNNEETRRRLGAEPLWLSVLPKGNIRIAAFDEEGRIYQLRWVEGRMNKGDIIISPKSLKGRIYKKPPQKRRFIRLIPAYFPAGIDVALRNSERVNQKYALLQPEGNTGFDNSEAGQMIHGYYRLRQLRHDLSRFKELKSEDLDAILEENKRFLTGNNLKKPLRRDKFRLVKSLEGGFTDKLGRKNILASCSRIFSIELALRRQLEVHFPSVVLKYGANTEILNYFRDNSRLTISGVASELENKQTLRSLRMLSDELLKRVRVRPYILVARKAVELIGLMDLPEGSISRGVQERGRKRYEDGRLKQATVSSLILGGNSDEARIMLEKIRGMFTKVLEVHEDYTQVKPSRKKTKTEKIYSDRIEL